MPVPIGSSWKFPAMASPDGGSYPVAALGMTAMTVNSPMSLISLEMLHATLSAPFVQSSLKLEHCSWSNFHLLLLQASIVLPPKVWPMDQQHWNHLGACQKGRILDCTPDLLKQILYFNQIPGVSSAHLS